MTQMHGGAGEDIGKPACEAATIGGAEEPGFAPERDIAQAGCRHQLQLLKAIQHRRR